MYVPVGGRPVKKPIGMNREMAVRVTATVKGPGGLDSSTRPNAADARGRHELDAIQIVARPSGVAGSHGAAPPAPCLRRSRREGEEC